MCFKRYQKFNYFWFSHDCVEVYLAYFKIQEKNGVDVILFIEKLQKRTILEQNLMKFLFFQDMSTSSIIVQGYIMQQLCICAQEWCSLLTQRQKKKKICSVTWRPYIFCVFDQKLQICHLMTPYFWFFDRKDNCFIKTKIQKISLLSIPVCEKKNTFCLAFCHRKTFILCKCHFFWKSGPCTRVCFI